MVNSESKSYHTSGISGVISISLEKTTKLCAPFKNVEVIQKCYHFSKWLNERPMVFEMFENILTDDS